MLPARPLRSTGITPLLATMGLSDSQPGPPLVIDSLRPLGGPVALSPVLPGLPGSSTDLSARCPQPPRQVRRMLAHCFPAGGRLHHLRQVGHLHFSVTRPNRVRFRYGSQVCFPGFRRTDYSASLRFRYMLERAIYMVNPFKSEDQPGLAWRTQGAKTSRYKGCIIPYAGGRGAGAGCAGAAALTAS